MKECGDERIGCEGARVKKGSKRMDGNLRTEPSKVPPN